MHTRKMIAFGALPNNRFVKIHENRDKKIVEIIDDKTTLSIEITLPPLLILDTIKIISLEDEKMILIFFPTRDSPINATLALIDINKASCVYLDVRARFLCIFRSNSFCILPDNILLISSINRHPYLFSYENNILKEEKKDHYRSQLPDYMASCTTFSNKILYCPGAYDRLVLAEERVNNVKAHRKVSDPNEIWCNIEQFGFFLNGDIVCSSHHKKSYFRPIRIHFFDANLAHRTTVCTNSFDEMAIIEGEYVALMTYMKSDLYVEVYNNEGKKIKDHFISNLSQQLFTVTPEGKLVSCSQLGDIMVHNLDLSTRKYHKVYSKVKSSLKPSDPYASLDKPADLVCEYLGFFSKKIPNTHEIIYPAEHKDVVSKFRGCY